MAAASYALPQYRPYPFDPNAVDANGNPIQPQDNSGGAAFNPQGSAPQDSTGSAIGGGNPVFGDPSATTIPSLNLDPNQDIHDQFYDDQGQIQAGAQQINSEATNQLGYYGNRQATQAGLTDQALSDLKTTPGYTPQEASQINVDYGGNKTSQDDLGKQFLTSGEQAGIAGDPNAPVGVAGAGTAAEGAQLNAYGANVGNQLAAYQSNLGGQVQNYQQGVGGAVDSLGSGLDSAQDKFGKLDSAVSDPSLAFDPNSTEKQLSDADVQQMKTAAGTRIGNQYKTAQDQLQRNAAAAGNTSPLAIAAANARLQTQEASDQGDAETNADIAAKQAQYDRASGIEGQRYGETSATQGMKAGAATTEEQAAQAAAGLAGTQGISAAEAAGQAGIGASEAYNNTALSGIQNYGQTATSTAADMSKQNTAAATTAEEQAAQRAAALAANRQSTQSNVSNTEYGQGMQTQQATSQGAQATGNARIQGNQSYLQGVAGQGAQAQTGGATAVSQQLGAYGTQTTGVNNSTAARANYEVGGTTNSATNQAAKIIGALADGGVVDEPTVAKVGERGPELIVPIMPRYGERRKAA